MLPAALTTLEVPGSVIPPRGGPTWSRSATGCSWSPRRSAPSPAAAWSPPSRTGSSRCAGTPARHRSSSQAPGPCRSLVTSRLRETRATPEVAGRGVDAPPRLGRLGGPILTMDRRPTAVRCGVVAGRAAPSMAKLWARCGCGGRVQSGCLSGHEPPGSLVSGDAVDNPDRTGMAPPPRPTTIDLDLQREAQECPDQHDQPQDGDVLQRGLHGDGPDDVGRDQELQPQQNAAPEHGP